MGRGWNPPHPWCGAMTAAEAVRFASAPPRSSVRSGRGQGVRCSGDSVSSLPAEAGGACSRGGVSLARCRPRAVPCEDSTFPLAVRFLRPKPNSALGTPTGPLPSSRSHLVRCLAGSTTRVAAEADSRALMVRPVRLFVAEATLSRAFGCPFGVLLRSRGCVVVRVPDPSRPRRANRGWSS